MDGIDGAVVRAGVDCNMQSLGWNAWQSYLRSSVASYTRIILLEVLCMRSIREESEEGSGTYGRHEPNRGGELKKLNRILLAGVWCTSVLSSLPLPLPSDR